jgi:LysR family transcriptional activator of nhaA
MTWLNYHHLLYFHTVVREGGVSAAARVLHVAQPTVSAQIKTLEDQLGEKLLMREGRGVGLTEVGRTVYAYADEIFSLGREMMDTLRNGMPGHVSRLRVGIADVVPKLVARRLLLPALSPPVETQLLCREDRHERLLADLAAHELDLVITDHPLGPADRVKAFNHQLGESGVSFLAAHGLATRLDGPFPKLLGGAPFILPLEASGLRRSLEAFFETEGLSPRVVAECEDSALAKVLGEAGVGVYCVPTLAEEAAVAAGGVEVVGRTEAVRERYWAISPERRLKHPAVLAISRAARGGRETGGPVSAGS